MATIDAGALSRHLAALPAPRGRPTDGPAIAGALTYLRKTLHGYGWEVADQPCHDEELGDGVNVVATLPGTVRPAALVVVGAHHDTVPGTPGADDNGSGLAGLLELGRVLALRRWEATIQLVAFDFEEIGAARFSGSTAYVNALRGDQTEFRGAFIFEMIGYRSVTPGSQQVPAGLERIYPDAVGALEGRGRRGDFIAALGSERGESLLSHFARSASSGAPELSLLALPVPDNPALRDLFRSDHVPFWQADLPAVMLTDTADFRNPHYHQPSDLPETLDPTFWRDVVAATLAAVAGLAVPAEEIAATV